MTGLIEKSEGLCHNLSNMSLSDMHVAKKNHYKFIYVKFSFSELRLNNKGVAEGPAD